MPALTEINILILGETGVGKSTWINSFINFLTYESLEEAAKGKFISLIPGSFPMYDDNFQKITIQTGEDKNENNEDGQSATQEAQVYPFKIGNTMIRLIDTPGIGDTRGIEQDKQNFQNILATLSYLEEIHAICILLKPNSARLTVMFRFCIKELLTYLHRDASQNIMFCLTNSRATFYRPADTMTALQSLLKENPDVNIKLEKKTVYCYDSEAYRFLAAIKHTPPINFSDDERQNFSCSWQKSISEVTRMLNYIRDRKPHKIQSTLSLNHARQLVEELSRPLVEIGDIVRQNIQNLEKETKEVHEMEADITKLARKQHFDKVILEQYPLNYPRTVCAHPDCTSFFDLGDTKCRDYKTVCHDNCRLTGVNHDVVGDIKLMGCVAFWGNKGVCKRPNCKHPYREHLHIFYESRTKTIQVENESITTSLKETMSATEMKNRLLADLSQRRDEYQLESEKIWNAAVRFAHFLKSNAITPYNDAVTEYMNHLIGQEGKSKDGCSTKDKTNLENLKKRLASYENQKQLLEKGDPKSGIVSLEP